VTGGRLCVIAGQTQLMGAIMADYDNKPEATQGTMDVSEQKRTFAGFIQATIWVVGLSCLALIFLALANS